VRRAEKQYIKGLHPSLAEPPDDEQAATEPTGTKQHVDVRAENRDLRVKAVARLDCSVRCSRC
jgi:hypothetical protein